MGELNLERSKVKFDLWERKLLDLSTRNSLLNLRIKGSSIPLFVPGCANIEDLIAQDKNFTIISRGEDDEPEEEELLLQRPKLKKLPMQRHRLKKELNRPKKLKISLFRKPFLKKLQ